MVADGGERSRRDLLERVMRTRDVTVARCGRLRLILIIRLPGS